MSSKQAQSDADLDYRENLTEWGRSDRMSPFETLTWRMEADPRLKSTIMLVEVLDRTPDWDRLEKDHEWATRAVRRFREKVVEPPVPIGNAAWVIDPNFDLGYHLRRMSLPGPGTMRQLLDVAQQQAMTPFDRARPPWEATLVEGLEGGRAGYILKLHHSATDGLGLMQLMSMLHGRGRRPSPKPQPDAPAPGELTPTKLLVEEVRTAVSDAPATLVRQTRRNLKWAAKALGQPTKAADDVSRLVGSLKRVLTPPPVPRSPLLTKRSSLSWHFETHEVQLADLKAAAKAGKGSLNDAFIAAVLGGFRLYHEHFDVQLDSIPIAIPISLRTNDDPIGGNRFAGARFGAPMAEPDPAERMRLVREFVLDARDEPAIDALTVMAPALNQLPTAVLTELLVKYASGHDIQASNVPGLSHDAYLAGAHITHMFPFGPLPGCAAMIALVSHGATCCIGANVDPAAVTDPTFFGECLRAGFDEVLALRKRKS